MCGFYHPDNKRSLCCHMGKCCSYDLLCQWPYSKKFVVRVLILVGCSTFHHWNKSTFTTLRSKFSFDAHAECCVVLYSTATVPRCKECPQLPKHIAGELVLAA